MSTTTEALKRLLTATKVYAFNYMQDEADSEDGCVCGPKQHAEAVEVFAAIREAERAAEAPAPAAEARQPIVGRLMDEISALPVLWGLNEPGALLRNSDVFNVLVKVGKEYASALPQVAAEAASIEYDPEFQQRLFGYSGATPDNALRPYNKLIAHINAWGARRAASAAPEDAAYALRYRWLREYMASAREDQDDALVRGCCNDDPAEFDAAVDAIMSSAAPANSEKPL